MAYAAAHCTILPRHELIRPCVTANNPGPYAKAGMPRSGRIGFRAGPDTSQIEALGRSPVPQLPRAPGPPDHLRQPRRIGPPAVLQLPGRYLGRAPSQSPQRGGPFQSRNFSPPVGSGVSLPMAHCRVTLDQPGTASRVVGPSLRRERIRALLSQRSGAPTSRSAKAAYVIAARPLFMSDDPRPNRLTPFSTASNCAELWPGTTS
jgi:hypothetical protein